jgi:large subunit ribosomal protein L3
VSIGIIGKKIGMTQVFTKDGALIPVTVIEAGPCAVVQKKINEKDGYSALKLGFAGVKSELLNKPDQGQFKNLDGKAFTVLKEFRVEESDEHNVGDQLTIDIFELGEKVIVTGVTKGKGFAGVIKRWGFARGPKTHGSKHHRAPGSTGMCAYPSKVLKGKKMPGHMGTDRMTFKNIEIIDKRSQDNLLLVKGNIPGAKNGIITVSKS